MRPNARLALLCLNLALPSYVGCGESDGSDSTTRGDGDGDTDEHGDGDGDGDGDGVPAGPVDSQAIPTIDMFPTFSAVDDGEGTVRVAASLNEGGLGPDILLSGSDRLVASSSLEAQEMQLVQIGNYYDTLLMAGFDSGRVQVAFERDAQHESALVSTATMPPPFEMSVANLLEGGEFARGQDLVATWEPSPETQMRFTLEGRCLDPLAGVVEDSGQLILAADTITAVAGSESDTCGVAFTLQRFQNGETDPAFGEHGVFTTMQRRRITFQSTPE